MVHLFKHEKPIKEFKWKVKPSQAPHDQIIVACLAQMECPGTPGLWQALGQILQMI